MITRACPRCGRPVDPTARKNIAGHYRPDGVPCKSSGEPFTTTRRP